MPKLKKTCFPLHANDFVVPPLYSTGALHTVLFLLCARPGLFMLPCSSFVLDQGPLRCLAHILFKGCSVAGTYIKSDRALFLGLLKPTLFLLIHTFISLFNIIIQYLVFALRLHTSTITAHEVFFSLLLFPSSFLSSTSFFVSTNRTGWWVLCISKTCHQQLNKTFLSLRSLARAVVPL